MTTLIDIAVSRAPSLTRVTSHKNDKQYDNEVTNNHFVCTER